MKRLFLSILLLGSLASAGVVQLGVGQKATLGEQQLTVIRVQDSRCLPDVKCVWAGKLEASVLVREGRRLTLRKLLLGGPAQGGLRLLLATPAGERPLRLTFSDAPAGGTP